MSPTQGAGAAAGRGRYGDQGGAGLGRKREDETGQGCPMAAEGIQIVLLGR